MVVLVAEMNLGEKVTEAKVEPWFKPKSGGIIPRKRKLVKRMIFDYLVESIASLFRSRAGSTSSTGPPPSNNCSTCFKTVLPPPATSNGKKKKAAIFPKI
ncbi:hypothetical protein L1049_027254 [Liquidambar formosana]|uniref:Uncharacterized protein n=1 Tax=Liquidambar formosana TaxID=63359 RepID=A0AAP0N624_LIQFO